MYFVLHCIYPFGYESDVYVITICPRWLATHYNTTQFNMFALRVFFDKSIGSNIS